MSYLLDTHVVLWWLADDHRLSAAVRGLLEDGTQQVAVSAISAWEISIKKALGELDAPDNLSQVLNDSGFSTLAFGVDHATVAGSLPPEHSDPFDRALVGQAVVERLTVVTSDPVFARYAVPVYSA